MSEVNPYSAPEHSSSASSVRQRFRCTLLGKTLLRLVAGRPREPRFHEGTGEFELYQGPRLQRFAMLLVFGPVVAICFVFLYSSLSADVWEWSPVFMSALAGGVLWFSREAVFFTDEYVRRRGPFWLAARLNWADVVSLQVARCGAIDLADSKNVRIRIHADLHGQRHFLSQLRKSLSGELIQNNLLDLAEREKLDC